MADANEPEAIEVDPQPLSQVSVTKAVALQMLRTVLGKPEAQFNSPEQEELLMLNLAKDYDVVGILPPGGGKSVCWEVPAYHNPDRIIVVCTPFLTLIQEQVSRAKKLGINAIHWKPCSMVPSRIALVFVSWETIKDPDFEK